MKIFVTYVRPIVEYAAIIWSPYLVKDIMLLETVQRRFTKCLKGQRGLSYDARLTNLNIPSLEQRRLRGDLIETYKWLNGAYDHHLQIFNQSPAAGRNLRGHVFKLYVHPTRIDARKYFFTNRVVKPWNSLPNSLPLVKSLSLFKCKLDSLAAFKPAYNR